MISGGGVSPTFSHLMPPGFPNTSIGPMGGKLNTSIGYPSYQGMDQSKIQSISNSKYMGEPFEDSTMLNSSL